MGSNAGTVREIYEAFGRGDVATVLGAMDPKIEWQEPESLPFDNQVGPQAVAEGVFGPLMTLIDGFNLAVDDVIDGGDAICTTGTYRGTAVGTGSELNAPFVHVWRFGSDGKVTGFRTHTDTYLYRQALGTA